MYGIFPKSFLQMLWNSGKSKILQIAELMKGKKFTEEQLSEIYKILSSDEKVKAWWKQWGEFTTLLHDMRLLFLKDKVAGFENLIDKIKFAKTNSFTNEQLVETFTSDELNLLSEAAKHKNFIHFFQFLPDIVKPNVWVESPPLFSMRGLFNAANTLRTEIKPIHPFMKQLTETELQYYDPTHYYDPLTDSYIPNENDVAEWSRNVYDTDGKTPDTPTTQKLYKMLPDSFNKSSK